MRHYVTNLWSKWCLIELIADVLSNLFLESDEQFIGLRIDNILGEDLDILKSERWTNGAP